MYKPKENIWDVESSNNYEEVTNYIKKKTEKLEKIRHDLIKKEIILIKQMKKIIKIYIKKKVTK